jgi:hypothetical protein
MCEVSDYDHLEMLPYYRSLLKHELKIWHSTYLPLKIKAHDGHGLGTVLDVGAGCGETAQFYLNHGAERVISIENDPDCLKCLRTNFEGDPRVTIVDATLSMGKIDINGFEEGWVFETHEFIGPRKLSESGTASIWRIEARSSGRSSYLLRRWIHLKRIGTAHWIRIHILDGKKTSR